MFGQPGIERAPFDTQADRTVCYESQSDDEPVWLDVPSPHWTVNPTNDTVETYEITLHNDSDDSISFNLHSAEILDQYVKEWVTISNHDRTGTVTLDPGGTYHWVLSRESHPPRNAEQTDYITADIDPGKYALLIEIRGDTGLSLACVATFTLTVENS